MEYRIANDPATVLCAAWDKQLLVGCGHSGCEEHLDLPPGFPSTLDSKLAWKGSDFKNEDAYVCHLTEEDIAEIRFTLEKFKGKSACVSL